MEPVRFSWFTHNWPQKLIALIAALVVWYLVHQSISATKTIPNIPIRVINLPQDRTISGLLPNGIYNKRITLTLTGTKSVIEHLEPGDMEVVLDATHRPDEWVVQITKKNIISLDPEIDLSKHITDIAQPELVIKLSRLVTVQIPVTVLQPTGTAPKGYQFLDLWPRKLVQTVSGPEDEVEELEADGLEIQFDLNKVSKEELDAISSRLSKTQEDEVTFLIPSAWKKIHIPCQMHSQELLNDPAADFLRIDFLRESLIPLDHNLPILVFYPLDSSNLINPTTAPIATNSIIQKKDEIPYLARPLFISGTSRRFVDLVRAYLSITVNAVSDSSTDRLNWNVQVVNPKALEDQFVTLLSNDPEDRSKGSAQELQRELFLRTRFREYLQNLRLYTGKQRKLSLDCRLHHGAIHINTDLQDVK